MDSRFTEQPAPRSFRPVYVDESPQRKTKKIILEPYETEPEDSLLGKLWKWSILLSSLLGLSVSAASLFATWLTNSKVSTSFSGVVGTFFQHIETHYGQMGILSFWLVCLIYFFFMAYRSAIKL